MAEAATSFRTPWYRRYGWAIPFSLGALLGLFGLGVIFMGTDPNDFGSSTGTAWEAFSSASPKVAQYLNRVERLLGAISLGFGAWTAVVAYVYLKRGDRTAWRAMWLVPITLAMTAAVFIVEEASGLWGLLRRRGGHCSAGSGSVIPFEMREGVAVSFSIARPVVFFVGTNVPIMIASRLEVAA